jgi:hypothetical protein
MWGKRKKRRAQLSRQLALGLLEDAMGRVQQQEEQEEQDEPAPPYPEAAPAPAAPPDRPGLRTADVPVENSAAPEPPPDDDPPPLQQELPAQRTGESTRHGTFG